MINPEICWSILKCLDPEMAVFLGFMDLEIRAFLQFLDPEIFWFIFRVSGSRNHSIFAFS